ncbi:Site-specific recombinase XerD [Pseudosulfitobacter pseudonitzschiae]|uniref:Tyr recombinase domain-containing protein n=1 Tax=Pseudosulfitobacter pseudonitzschiae TaxID=1402135 RepID=A0A073J4Y0_9RHOB|nr:site-specific integrase [Pseudosulfitobacter pseudonitzschiae]KEJ96865.1 hypothetical protein SUH3_08805 [Pseudosulfitobacter pseudonitzschiae]SHF45167.1 Site-specific recombinase XerD [Pseudosulfitobacter pseudonitzschiae]
MMNTLEQTAHATGENGTVTNCPFQSTAQITGLDHREYPYWHVLLKGRHIGVHRPDDRICNWVARTLRTDGKYRQKCLGPALDLSKPSITYDLAISRAFEWFETGAVSALSVTPEQVGRVTRLCVCPIGDTYTVGHAMADYLEWSKLARSPGGHYNNLTLMNYHLVPEISGIPIEEFSARHLQALAQTVLERPPKRGFENPRSRVDPDTLTTDEIRRRKRTFNSLVTILRTVFRYAWESGRLQSERSWKCLNRVSVNHQPRTIFLTRTECASLIEACGPSLRQLVLAALYTGCRVGELGELRVEDVARDGFGISVKAFKRGPARFVFLPAEGMTFFLNACQGKDPMSHIFLSTEQKPWKRQHTLQFRTAVAKAKLPKEFVFHGLRHTYASDLVANGASLDTVAKQLGHANTLTVMNTYGHLAEAVREMQVQQCFSQLSPERDDCSEQNIARFKAIRDKEDPKNWREKGRPTTDTTLPRSPLARPSAEVMQVFSKLPGEH